MPIKDKFLRRGTWDTAVCLVACLSGSAVAAPAIQGVAGAFNHKAAITINGSGFGTKATAAPVVWDDATGSDMSAKWTNTVPDSAPNPVHNLQYRSVGYRGVPGPHANATKYIVGGHNNLWQPNAGGNVMFLKTRSSHSDGDIIYARSYIRLDPLWQFGATLADNNHKWWITNFGGNGPYEQDEFYIDYDQGGFDNGTTPVQHKYSPSPSHPLASPDNNGHNNWWGNSANPVSNWTLYEVEAKISTTSAGYLKVWADGKLIMNYAGRTDSGAFSVMSMGFGGYSSTYVISPVNNFRYFADVYLDYSRARVVLANNADLTKATIVEPQIPSSWSTVSITASMNLGKFTAGQTAYLFVIDPTGASNTTGFPIALGGSGGATLPAPTNLRVQ